jgi:hypothetical protein
VDVVREGRKRELAQVMIANATARPHPATR